MSANQEDLHYNPDCNYDDATLSQQRAIEEEIANQHSLIGELEDFSSLEREYSQDDAVYQQKIQELKKSYDGLRRTRGDGNCFYRAFGFSYFETLLEDKEEFRRFEEVVKKTKDDLIGSGFPEMTITDFYETFLEVLQAVGNDGTLDDLVSTFNNQGMSDYLVVYLRILVSGHLQQNSEFFENFMEGGQTVKEFCMHEVEPFGRESDHIHVIALTAATGVGVAIEYVDRNQSQTPLIFPDGCTPKITLLYRPGHYDVLYRHKVQS